MCYGVQNVKYDQINIIMNRNYIKIIFNILTSNKLSLNVLIPNIFKTHF